jgi:Surfeit locus protein 6
VPLAWLHATGLCVPGVPHAADTHGHQTLQSCWLSPSQAKAAGEAWNAALARARGEKVLDDPTRLRRSLKKESKAAAKRGAAWAERTQQQQQSQAERQKR